MKVYGDGAGKAYHNVAVLVTTLSRDCEELTSHNFKAAVIACDLSENALVAETHTIIFVAMIATALMTQGLVVRAPRNDSKGQVRNMMQERTADGTTHPVPIARPCAIVSQPMPSLLSTRQYPHMSIGERKCTDSSMPSGRRLIRREVSTGSYRHTNG